MGIRGIVVVTGATVLSLGGLAASAPAQAGVQKPLPLDTSIPAGTSQSALATSADRLQLIDELRTAAAASPQRFGGVATDGDADIRLCDNGSGVDAAVDTPVSALRASGATVTVVPCAHNLNDLNKVLGEVATSEIFSSNGVTLLRWGIDYGRNAVEIGVDAVPAGFVTKVAALWGDAVYVMIPPATNLQSRTNDVPPLYGSDWTKPASIA